MDIPLGGNKKGKTRAIINVFAVFIISGFWHGANWTFIVWGLIHGLVYLIYFGSDTYKDQERFSFSIIPLSQVLVTFGLVSLAFVFFRSPSVSDSIDYLSAIYMNTGNSTFFISSYRHMIITGITCFGILIMMGHEIAADRSGNFEVNLSKVDLILLGIAVLFLGAFRNHLDFIYFQF